MECHERGTGSPVAPAALFFVFAVVAAATVAAFPLNASAATGDECPGCDTPFSVTVTPGFLNTVPCKAVSGKITISSEEPETYEITIAGVPDEWIDYKKSVYVESEETVNFIVNPKVGGNYYLAIRVSGPDHTYDYRNRLWVAGKETPAADGDLNGNGDAVSGNGPDAPSLDGGLTGMFLSDGSSAIAAASAVIIVALILTVFLGYRSLKGEISGEQ